jgi:hypothetical protein
MNKKTIIIGLIITGVVVAGGIYLYRRNKKAQEQQANVVTEADAMAVLDALNKKDTPLSATQSKMFVDLYISKIDKPTHQKILTAVQKKESDWTLQDKLNFAILLESVLVNLKK